MPRPGAEGVHLSATAQNGLTDAWVAGGDLVLTASAMTGALLGHFLLLAAVAGLWAVLTLRQGYLAARSHR